LLLDVARSLIDAADETVSIELLYRELPRITHAAEPFNRLTAHLGSYLRGIEFCLAKSDMSGICD
jgi:hypothetical protein